MTQTITLSANQVSQIISVAPGTRITSSGNGSISWVAGALADAQNGSGTWVEWAKGSSAGYMDTVRQMCIRATATGNMTVTLDEGLADEYPENIYFDPEMASYQTDASGNVTGLVGPDREKLFQMRRRGNIGMRIFGGRTETDFSDGTVAKTHHVAMTTAVHFDAVRIVLAAANAVAVPVTKAAVAVLPSAADLNGNALAWVACTFSGAASGSIPERVATKRRTYLVSDITPISSVDRTDGGAYPLLAARAFLGTAGTYTLLGKAGGADSFTNWSTHPSGRIHSMRYNDGDCVTTPGNFASTVGQNTSPIVGVIYYARGRVVNVAGFGDSITEGRGTYLGEGFGFPACRELSTSSIAYEWSNFGWSGVQAVDAAGGYLDHVRDAIAAGLPIDIALMPVSSPNGHTPPITDASVIIQGRRPLVQMVGASADAGIQPIVWTWMPTNPALKDYNASDSLRRQLNSDVQDALSQSAPIADLSTAISGATDVDGQVLMADGLTTDNIHPNDAGNAALVPLVKAAIKQVY